MNTLVNIVALYCVFGLLPGLVIGLGLERNRELLREKMNETGGWISSSSENSMIAMVVVLTIGLWPLALWWMMKDS